MTYTVIQFCLRFINILASMHKFNLFSSFLTVLLYLHRYQITFGQYKYVMYLGTFKSRNKL